MKPSFRSREQVIVNASLETVLAFNMDITKIPEFHPRVFKVELISGKAPREPGVSYQCHFSGGKHTCLERGIEIVPDGKDCHRAARRHIPISQILPDYIVETTFQCGGSYLTKMEISHYYSTKTWKARLLNLVAKRRIARETQATPELWKRIVPRANRGLDVRLLSDKHLTLIIREKRYLLRHVTIVANVLARSPVDRCDPVPLTPARAHRMRVFWPGRRV